jgi:YD repeat-containing protein
MAGLLAAWAAMTGFDCHAQTVTYSYDALGRVIVAVFPDGSCTGYQYDAAGNRTQYISAGSAAPTANAINVSTYQDIPSSFDPRTNNPSCEALTVSAVGAAGHGTTAIVSGGTGVTYTPGAGYTGTDSFTYTLTNGAGSTMGSVAMTVNAPTLPPIIGNGVWNFLDYICPPPGVTPIIDNPVPGSSPYGYNLVVTSLTQGKHGAVTSSGAYITYTYGGTISVDKDVGDSFTYTLSDQHGHSASGTGTVSISISTCH